MESAASLETVATQSPSLFGRILAFGIHTAIVYLCAVRLSPWLVFHWFGWLAPVLSIYIPISPADWYLRHLEIVTIFPALMIGYVNVARFSPTMICNYIGEHQSGSAAAWSWLIPAIVLAYKMALYHVPSSVFSSPSPMSRIAYFFDIQTSMPTLSNFGGSDPVRVLAQMIVTAPFCAGVAYSIGSVASRYDLIQKVFRDRPNQDDSPI